jgi:hypothetical protein
LFVIQAQPQKQQAELSQQAVEIQSIHLHQVGLLRLQEQQTLPKQQAVLYQQMELIGFILFTLREHLLHLQILLVTI